jgi:hypothetical protein
MSLKIFVALASLCIGETGVFANMQDIIDNCLFVGSQKEINELTHVISLQHRLLARRKAYSAAT